MKNLLKSICLLILIVFAGCQKDDLQLEVSDHNSKTLNVEKGSFTKFKLGAFTNTLKIYNQDKIIKSNLTIQKDGFYFVIDTSSVLKMSDNNTISYTLKVKNNQTPYNSFQNIVISQYQNLPPKAFLFTYFPDQDYKNRIKQDPETHFSGTASLSRLDINTIRYQTQSCTTTSDMICCIGSEGAHTPYGGDCRPIMVTLTNCLDDSSGGGGSSGGSFWGGGSNNNSGGGSQGSGSGIYGIFTRTLPFDRMDLSGTLGANINEKFYFIEDNIALSGPKIAWLTASADRINAIYDYLSQNNTAAGRVFVNSVISHLLQNPNENFNNIAFNRTSFDSNAGIDTQNNVEGNNDNTVYSSFNPQQVWSNIPSVIPTNQFVGWGAVGVNRNCMDYAKAQIAKKGYKVSNYGSVGQTFQIYTTQSGVNNTTLSNGLSYLKSALSRGIPVVVGVDDAPGHPGNLDSTTDHFIVIVGMGSNNNGNYFQFYDNATGNNTNGTSPLNLLYHNPTTGIISGTSQATPYSTGLTYTLTMIRKSKPL